MANIKHYLHVSDNWEVYFESLRPDYTCQVLIIDQTNTVLMNYDDMLVFSSIRESKTSSKSRLQSSTGRCTMICMCSSAGWKEKCLLVEAVPHHQAPP